MVQVNQALLELFRGHGVAAEREGEWIVFPGRDTRAAAAVVDENPQATFTTVQLDVRLELAPGETLVESVGGVGATADDAARDALKNFVASSFHVLLAAFFVPDDPQVAAQVTQEQWVVGGRPARVTVGGATIRGNPPVQGAALLGWYDRFEQALKRQQLRPGTHWVRLYYGQMQGTATACEVLRNNDTWDPVQAEMTVAAWPAGEDFYSLRVFLVMKVEAGDPAAAAAVTPETAVEWLAEIIAPRGEFTEDDAYAAMAAAGIPDALADRAYKFTQTAWARVLLDRLGVRSSPDYVCFDRDGNVAETGRLADEPCFAAASRLVPRYAGSPGFRQMNLLSADVNAVNSALYAGSQPQNLVTTPAFLFLAAPTDAGMANAQRVMDEYAAAMPRPAGQPAKPETPKPPKPWWRR